MMIIKNTKNAVVALVLIALVSALALAQGGTPAGQEQQTRKGAVIKGKAPVNKEVVNVKLPRARDATLKSGLRGGLVPNET
jgi:hypothetical protein